MRTTTEMNKEIMRRLIDGFNKGDTDIYDELVSPDFVNHTDPPDSMNTRDAWKRKATIFHEALPDIHVEIEHLIAEGDYVITHITSIGTQTGELMGIPATGKQATVRGVHINKIVDGKIVERWELTDMLGFMMQIGVVSLPEV